jgi:hypothetical protein
MGLLGELIVRVYNEAQDKPTYMVRELLWRQKNDRSQTPKQDIPSS